MKIIRKIRRLITKEKSDNSNDFDENNSLLNAFDQSELHIACYDNNDVEIKKCISAGIDLNLQDKRGKTALHYTVINNNYDAVYLLLSNKVIIDIEDHFGNYALWDAVLSCNGDFRIIEQLLLCSSDMNHKNINAQSVYDAVKLIGGQEMIQLFKRFRY
ncbi:MAG: ankyrin repeat domain-containing protein [Saccharospirillaceae bacterium]|nr:ankyrin repeat domain-containing protein [Pseudomonadales bacterium]NRB80155.1 ankyrin repeat domain-containing protein [Saccharospirillaceae bacterium]